ncbi:MAG: T9SS type A sorting domain-containing protein [Bacteroidetes bacterium]|nr:T9SS type A sorting domain-containing protein [Bacteroidota bacterium]
MKTFLVKGILGGALLLLSLAVQAQKQYWGVARHTVSPSGHFAQTPLPNGGIIRLDALGMGPDLVLAFDTAFAAGQGLPIPSCGLVQTSNGLVYYMTQEYRLPDRSRIVAIDPVTDSTWEAALLGTPDFPYRGQRAFSSLVEGLPGSLIDASSSMLSPTVVYRFNLATSELSVITQIPTGVASNGDIVRPTLMGTLGKGTNGKLYAGQTPWDLSTGKLIEVDPVGQTYTPIYDCMVAGPLEGFLFKGDMIQVGQKMYASTACGGSTYIGFFEGRGCGTIGSLDLNTNIYHKVLDLDSSAFGPPRGFVPGPDGLLYGEAQSNDTTVVGVDFLGCLFAYNPATNTLHRKAKYGLSPLGYGITGPFYGTGLLSASNGKIYGSFQKGIFEYDPIADTLRLRAPLQYVVGGTVYPYGLNSPMIEICRKPNYKPRSTTSFTVCAGSHFAYDLHNVNATGVVWRRNGNVVATQHNQRLEFSAITAADAGTWACTLTNQCGTTEPPPITITVQSGAFTASTIGGDTLLCGTGDSAVLTGNNGGTWSTGATTPTLAVTEPGYYYVTNQNACGGSMSNLIHVAHSDSARAPTMLDHLPPTASICPGDSMLLQGNQTDIWGVAPTGVWSTGATGPSTWAKDPGWYYVTATNACNSDTSAGRMLLDFFPPTPTPQVSFFNGVGNAAGPWLCTGDSVRLHSSDTAQPFWLQDGSYIATGPDLWVHAGGGGYQAATYYCGALVASAPFTITMDSLPPTAMPVIEPNVETLIGCNLDIAYISTPSTAYWRWSGSDGMDHYDTTATLTVDWNVGAYVLTAFNGCGDGPSNYISIYGEPPLQPQFQLADTLLCINHGTLTLPSGTPAGGTYSGAGVAGSTFSPALAGAGTHAITYTYGTGNCTAQATDSITVDLCAGVVETDHADGIRISPNPNNGTFQVRIERSFKVGSLLLYDANGKRVGKAVRLVPGANELHAPDLAAGLYQLRIELDGVVENRTVSVVK